MSFRSIHIITPGRASDSQDILLRATCIPLNHHFGQQYLCWCRTSVSSLDLRRVSTDTHNQSFCPAGSYQYFLLQYVIKLRTWTITDAYYILQGCKVILNMQHLAIEESKENRNDPSIANFTTDFIGLETDPDTYTLTSLAVPHLRKPTAW